MRVTIYQPRYFPQLHYYNRMFDADIFVILESAQYTKTLVHSVDDKKERHKSFQSDAVIKYPSGQYFLTIPVKHNGLQPIKQSELDYSSNWPHKHLATIRTFYGKSSNFNQIYPSLEQLLKHKYQTLAELNIASILWGIQHLLELPYDDTMTPEKMNTVLMNTQYIRLKKIVTDTEIGVQRPEGIQKGTEWTTMICERVGATEYFHGETAKNAYMDDSYYAKRNIKLVTQNWQCQEYTQQFADIQFLPNLSIIDLLCNVSPQKAREIIGLK